MTLAHRPNLPLHTLLAFWLAVVTLACAGASAALVLPAFAWVAQQGEALPSWVWAAPGAPGLVALLSLLLSFRTGRVTRGTKGRARTRALAVSTTLANVSLTGTIALLLWAAQRPVSLFPLQSLLEIHLLVPPAFEPLLLGLLGATGLGALLTLFALLGTFSLLTSRFRRIFFVVVDAVLGLGFLDVVLTYAQQSPDAPPPPLAAQAGHLVIVVLSSLRFAIHALPRLFDLNERFGFRALVATRHLRAKKSNFLATISVLSILAVTVSSCALSTTLSVMGGFRQDLKRKILGNNAHIVIAKDEGTFADWRPTLETVRKTPGVVAASAYISGEVMVTSASNLAGGELRGIDVDHASRVVDLESNLESGSLDYLRDPAAILDHGKPPRRDEPDGDTGDKRNRDTDSSPLKDIEALHDDASLGTDSVTGKDVIKGGAFSEQAASLGSLLKGPKPLVAPKNVLPGVIVGRELARSLRLAVGDEVNVVSPLGDLGPTGPMPKSRPFRVAGIFYSGMYEFDMKFLYVSLETAQRFLNHGDELSGIEAKVGEIEQAPAIAAEVQTRLQRRDLKVKDWQEANQTLFGALELEKLAMFLLLGIAILVAGFCVFGTLTLMVQEKRREVGILKAMGANRRDIITVFLLEGLMIGVLGAGLGLGLGYLACFAAEHFGIHISPEVYYIDRLPVHIDGSEFVLVGVASAVVCLLATVFPAYLASTVRPVDAIRND